MQVHSKVSRAALLIALATPAVAQTVNPTVRFTEIATSPTSDVPGTRDLAGTPVASKFLAIAELAMREDGGDWLLKAQTNLPTTHDQVLLRGNPSTVVMFAQDGQPLQGGVSGELYDFFKTPRPGAWDTAGNILFGARAKGGVASVFDKLIIVDLGGTHTIAAQMGDLLTNIFDHPTTPSGTQFDQAISNSNNSFVLLDTGEPSFCANPLVATHSSRYPAIIHGHTGFRQSGVSMIGTEIWDSFDFDAGGGTPDGLHWFAKGDTESATSIDNIFVVDDVVVLREGSPIAPGLGIYGDATFGRMLSNGDWYVRGRDASSTSLAAPDFAMRNNVILAKTGDAVGGGLPGENWGDSFTAFTGNVAGHWLISGNTTNPNVNEDTVLVYDGVRVILREGQPVDVDGNTFFDDDAFINSFQPDDLFLSSSNRVFLLVTLRNAALANIGDAMLEFDVETPPTSFCSGDGSLTDHTTPCPCGNNGLPGNGCGHSFDPNGANLSATGLASTDDVVLRSQFEPASSFTLFMQHENTGDVVFHDGVLCASNPLIRLRGRAAVGGEAFFPNSLFAQDSTTTLSQRGLVTVGSGATRYYAAWYRNASTTFCPPATANVTNGWQITW